MNWRVGLVLLIAIRSPPIALGQGAGGDGSSSRGEVDTGVVVEWLAESPQWGELAWLIVRPGGRALADVRGAMDRAPLHFERQADGFVSLAPVRIGAGDSVPLQLWLEGPDGGVETVERRVPVRPRTFPSEQLRVAPEFSRQPDSALTARIRAEGRRAMAVSQQALETPRLWDLAFRVPRASRVTSRFGLGREFNGELRSRHSGTDLDGEAGTPVHAANRGVVALVDAFYYGGNVVYVNHGAGLVTAYMHLSEALVQRGDTVVRGQLIGRVGATGRVTGPHLHWMARHGRVTVDALSLLRLPALPPAGAACSAQGAGCDRP